MSNHILCHKCLNSAIMLVVHIEPCTLVAFDNVTFLVPCLRSILFCICQHQGIPTGEHNTGSACPLNDNNVEGHAYLDYPSNPNIKSGGRFESNRFSQHWGQDVVPTTGGAGGFDADTPSLSAMAPSRFTAGSPPHGSAPEWDATPGRVGSLGVGAGESTPQQHLRHDAQMGQSSYADPESTGLSVEEDEIYDSRHFGF
eukprot:m.1135725 g.1135725  ORF g.1135725 m.1135725 type:complete len:199 (-) comp24429_c2_seq29:2394-2990(-)